MTAVLKVTFCLGLIGLSCLAAAGFGAVHNQLSFTVGPDYFYTIKFPQFQIVNLPPRGGAALVGVLASWWMGPLIGLPAFLVGLIVVPGPRAYLLAGLRAIGIVFLTTGAAAFCGLLLGYWRVGQGIDPGFWVPASASPADIIRAGSMHNSSYAGGALGALLAVVMIWRVRGTKAGRANAT